MTYYSNTNSFYFKAFGSVEEACYIDIDKQLITEEERQQLIQIYQQNSHRDENSHVFNRNKINEENTKRTAVCYDSQGNVLRRESNDARTPTVRVVHVDIPDSFTFTKKIRAYLGGAVRYSFLHTKPKWISSCHSEIRTPSLNICLLDSGASIYFFDETPKVIAEHKFNGKLGYGVVYNTARWHMIDNSRGAGERLSLSVNLSTETGTAWLRAPTRFLERAGEIYDNCYEN